MNTPKKGHLAALRLLLALLMSLAASATSLADVERYKNEAEFLARISALGHRSLTEGFESSDWDLVRSNYPVSNSLPSVTSLGVTWEAAGLDVWDYPTPRIHGVTTNNNWARTGNWGIYEDHLGDPIPTTIRVSMETAIYGIGGWFDTNPDGQSVGFLFEGRITANDPGYVLPGIGATYPGDNPSIGHEFVGIVDPAGFDSVVLTGTLEINEDNQLQGGIYFGADDFVLAVPTILTGDYNNNDIVDAADYTVWRDNLAGPGATLGVNRDPANTGVVAIADYDSWKARFGETAGSASQAAVNVPTPEPATVLLLLSSIAVGATMRSRNFSRRYMPPDPRERIPAVQKAWARFILARTCFALPLAPRPYDDGWYRPSPRN